MPVDKIMSSFVTHPGVPLLTLSERQASGVPVSQSRFFPPPATARTRDRWGRPPNNTDRPRLLKASDKPICRVLTRGLEHSARHGCWLADALCQRRRQGTTGSQTAPSSRSRTALTPPGRIDCLETLGPGSLRAGNCRWIPDLVLAEAPQRSRDLIPSTKTKVDSQIATEDHALSSRVWCGVNSVVCRAGEPGEKGAVRPAAASRHVVRDARSRGIPRCLPGAATATRVFAVENKKDKTLDARSRLCRAGERQQRNATLYDKLLAVSKTGDPGEKTDALRTLGRFHDPTGLARSLPCLR
jgi:aminopeptidase N/puromycin-sensitive aminopeptidase